MALSFTFEVRKWTGIPPLGYTWYDCTADVIVSDGVSWARGIQGYGPTDRVASGGMLTLTVTRTSSQSAIGAYTGKMNAKVRVTLSDGSTSRVAFIGRIREMTPGAGPFHDGTRVRLTATDWMDDAAEMPLKGITAQENKRSDQILTALAAAGSPAPESTSFDTDDTTFPFALDDVVDDSSRMLQALAKVVQSARGWLYLTGPGVLRYEKRTARAAAGSSSATFDNTVLAYQNTQRRGDLVNRAYVTVHPRRIDSAATTVLFKRFDIAAGQTALTIPALSAVTVFGPYGDPNNGNARCGGSSMQTPVSGTDYKANTAADGSGTSIVADLTVTPSFTANGVSVTLANGNAATMYVTLLQFKGKGVYNTVPVQASDRRIDGDEEYTDAPISVDLAYEANPNVGQAVASEIVNVYGFDTDRAITFNALTTARLTAAVTLDVGSVITLSETANGITARQFRIQRVQQTLTSAKELITTWGLVLDPGSYWWVLGQTGASELDSTTRLYY